MHAINSNEARLWTDINMRAVLTNIPNFATSWLRSARSSAREGSVCFLAEIDSKPGAAGVLCLHEGVALFEEPQLSPNCAGAG